MKSVISTFLLTVMLVVTIGVPVFRHSCEESDESELSLLSEKNCCTPNGAATETKIDSKCCSIEQIDTAFYYETLVNKVSSMPVVLVALEQLEVFKNIHFTYHLI